MMCVQIIYSRITQNSSLAMKIEEAENFNNRILESSLILCRSAGVFILARPLRHVTRNFSRFTDTSVKKAMLLVEKLPTSSTLL